MGENPTLVRPECFRERDYENITLYVPSGTIDAYKAADTWKNFLNIKEFDATDVDK